MVQSTSAVGRTEVRFTPDWREAGDLVSERIILSQYSNSIRWWLAFITTGSSAGMRAQQEGMSKSEMGLQNLWSG